MYAMFTLCVQGEKEVFDVISKKIKTKQKQKRIKK